MAVSAIVAEQGVSLEDLAATINSEHNLAYRATLDALTHAILCGEALIEARTNVPDGEWLRWVADNLHIGSGALHRYVRLATYKHHLLTAEHEPKSINAAIGYLRQIDAPASSTGRTGRKPSFDVDEAKRLRKQGLNFTQIGEALGVSDVAVWRQLTPGATAQAMRYTARARKQRRAAAKALAQQQRADAVARTAGNPAEAYALLRRCAVTLDRAILDTTDSDEIAQLREALHHTHKAEDAIVRALRLERAAL